MSNIEEQVMLYRRNSLGIGTWRVRGLAQTMTSGSVIIAHSVVEGGAEVTHVDPITINGSGRNIHQQLALEINSRIKRQMDKGYKTTRDLALLGSTNQLGLLNPMLAQKLVDVRLRGSDFDGAYVQPKYDGHRCLITKQGGEMLAYSRRGKAITTVPDILEDCNEWMQDGDTLDGELYCHGEKLQTIASWIKRDQPETKKLVYKWYDMVLNVPYAHRHRMMVDLFANAKNPRIMLTPTHRVSAMSQVYEFFRRCRAGGFEGAMLRLSRAGYEDNKRSDQLLKIKEREDGEVTVLGGRPAANGGAILRVRTDWGVELDVSAPGTLPEKQRVLEQISSYVGRRLTIEYAMLTADKVPFHCVATRWREDV